MTLTFTQKATLFSLKSVAGDGYADTSSVAFFDGRSTDAIGKSLRRLRESGFVAAKQRTRKNKPTQTRYQWRLSARGKRVVGL